MKNIKLLSCLTLLSITNAADYNNNYYNSEDFASSDYDSSDYSSQDSDSDDNSSDDSDYNYNNSYYINPEIIKATIDGDFDEVKNICTPTNINEQCCEGQTALMHSCINGSGDIFTFLMQNNADINIKDNSGNTALDYAIEHNRPEMIEFLLLSVADNNLSLEEALKKAAEIENINKQTQNMLEEISSYNPNINIIKSCISAGADVDAKYYNDEYDVYFTALMSAAQMRHTEIVRLLIDAGADVNARDNYGNPAWTYGYPEIANLLIDAGADVNAKYNNGSTALMSAARFGLTEIVKLLIAAGADVNSKCYMDKTALMEATKIGHKKMVKLLLNAGADLHTINKKGKTALTIAKENGHTEIAKLLKIYSNPIKRFKYKNANLIKALAIGTVVGVAYKLGQAFAK